MSDETPAGGGRDGSRMSGTWEAVSNLDGPDGRARHAAPGGIRGRLEPARRQEPAGGGASPMSEGEPVDCRDAYGKTSDPDAVEAGYEGDLTKIVLLCPACERRATA